MNPTPSESHDGSPSIVAAASNLFAWRLYAHLRHPREGNLFFSPHSLFTAFAMAYEGARGDTAREMARVFSFPVQGDGDDALGRGVQALSRAIGDQAAAGRYDLDGANGLWIAARLSLQGTYRRRIIEVYDATCDSIDFTDSDNALAHINRDVSEKTRQRISGLLPAGVVNPLTTMLITNAVSFRATWQNAFDPRRTETAPFHAHDGQRFTVPLMHRTGVYPYAETESLQIVSLPYGSGALSMVVLLPRTTTGMATLESELAAAEVDRGTQGMTVRAGAGGDRGGTAALDPWIRGLAPRAVEVWVPRFTLEDSVAIESPQAAALGMPLAFDEHRADFGGIAPEVFIRAAFHNAFVDVSETGTEAAAASAVVVQTRSAGPARQPPAVFRADRPFVFLIRDNHSGAILFLGRLTHP